MTITHRVWVEGDDHLEPMEGRRCSHGSTCVCIGERRFDDRAVSGWSGSRAADF